MRSGSQSQLVFEQIPFISDDDFEFAFAMPASTASGSESLSRSEEVTPGPIVQRTQTKPKSAQLLHGRSPLGLTTPIVADDLDKNTAVARPARILQLICDERRGAQPLTQIVRHSTSIPDVCEWKTLKAEPPCATVESTGPSVPRSHSQRRKRDTETPLARCLFKDFQLKFYRRRVVELALGKGLTRRFDLRIRTRGI